LKKIILITPWYKPAFKAGGPIVSVFNMAEMLSKTFEVLVVTSCFDLGEEVELEGLETTDFPYKVTYIHPKEIDKQFWKEQVAAFKPDLVWVSGIFSIPFSVKPILALRGKVPILVSPRGMVHDSALAVKPLKKKLFLGIAKLLNIPSKLHWHATNEAEKNFIGKNVQRDLKVFCLSNVPASLKNISPSSKEKGSLRLLIPARISAEKNNVFALEVLEKTANKNIELIFCGADGGGDYSELFHKKLTALTRQGFKVGYEGARPPQELEEVYLAKAHYMYLPSTGENFGHAITDALASSTPVILSDKTPWNDVEEAGVGFVRNLDVEQHTKLLAKLFEQENEGYTLMAEKCHSFLQTHQSLQTLEKDYITAIYTIINAR